MCEYCEKEKKLEQVQNDNMYFWIYGKHLILKGKIFSYNFGRHIIIDYCPKCGRKLGE